MHAVLRAARVVAAMSLLAYPGAAHAQERPLTLDRALALARQRAPTVLVERARVGEARGRLEGASVLVRYNPLVETGLGRRTSDRGDTVEGAVGVTQVFELGGRRGARIRAAEAGVDRATAGADDATRRLLRDVAVAFVRALYAEERLRLATSAESLAAEIVRITERRQHAGDAATLDVNLARTALGRARAERRSAAADHEASLGDLRMLLGLGHDEALSLSGDLADRRRYSLPALLARAPERSDLRALAAEEREANAQRSLGRAFVWPDVGLGVRYEREEHANVVLGTVTFTLPFFDHGQGIAAEASARSRRASLELEAGRRVVDLQVRTAFAVYGRRVAAVEELQQDTLALLDETEAMAQRAYETGQMSLAEVLLLRREILETRRSYLDRLLEAAEAGVELEAAAGLL